MTLTRPRYSPGGWTDAPAVLGAGRGLPVRTTQPDRRRPNMSTTPSIPGVDRDALADAIRDYIDSTGSVLFGITSVGLADAALAHIAAHHECACDREHDDEWVEVDEDTWDDLPDGTRLRREWRKWCWRPSEGLFVHRDDLPDPDADPDAEAANALRDASWNVPRLADGSRLDPLPGLAAARDLLAALREAGWAVVREGER